MEGSSEAEVVLTEKIKRWIRTALTTTTLEDDLRKKLHYYISSRRNSEEKRRKTIPFLLVKAVHECIQSQQGDLYLHELLEGSDVHLRQPEVVERNPELEARIQKLKAEQANKEYAHMTQNVDRKSKSGEGISTIGQEVKSMNRHLLAVFNFLLTVVGSFVFAYKATEYSLAVPSFEMLLSGMITATVVFFADVYFLIKYNV